MPFRKLEPLLTKCPLGIAVYEQVIVDGELEDLTVIWLNEVSLQRYGARWLGHSAKALMAEDWPTMRELYKSGEPFTYSRVYTPPDGTGPPISYTAHCWTEGSLVGVMVMYQEDLDVTNQAFTSNQISSALREVQQRSKDTLRLAEMANLY